MEWLAKHKWWVIGGFGVLAIIYIATRGSGATSSSATGTDVSGATDALAAQQAAGQQIAASLQANQDNNATQLALANVQATAAGTHDQLAAQVATSQINASEQVQSLLGALSAGVATTQSNNAVATQSIVTGGQVQQQQILADALIHQSDTQAAVAEAGYAATTNIAQIQANASNQNTFYAATLAGHVSDNNSRSWLQQIFG